MQLLPTILDKMEITSNGLITVLYFIFFIQQPINLFSDNYYSLPFTRQMFIGSNYSTYNQYIYIYRERERERGEEEEESPLSSGLNTRWWYRFKSFFYNHFQMNTLWKYMKPLVIDWIVLLFFCMY